MAKGKIKKSAASKSGAIDAGQCDTRKRPQGNERAKDDAKRLKVEQEALKISAIAQKEMAAANRDRVNTLKNNSLMKLLTLPTDNMEPELRD